jgi:hypothetical protein
MRTSTKLTSNSNDVLDVQGTLRKIKIRQIVAPLFAFMVAIAICLVAVFLISRSNSELYRGIIQVSSTVLGAMSFATIIWLELSLRDRDTSRLIMALYRGSVEQDRSNHTRTEEDQIDAEILAGNSQERTSPSR